MGQPFRVRVPAVACSNCHKGLRRRKRLVAACRNPLSVPIVFPLDVEVVLESFVDLVDCHGVDHYTGEVNNIFRMKYSLHEGHSKNANRIATAHLRSQGALLTTTSRSFSSNSATSYIGTMI